MVNLRLILMMLAAVRLLALPETTSCTCLYCSCRPLLQRE